MTTSQNQHRVDVQKSLHSNPNYTAYCSCGWCGQAHNTELDAENDGDEHIIAITR